MLSLVILLPFPSKLESQSSKNKEDPSIDPEQVKKDFEELKDKLINLLSELGDKDIDLKLENYVGDTNFDLLG